MQPAPDAVPVRMTTSRPPDHPLMMLSSGPLIEWLPIYYISEYKYVLIYASPDRRRQHKPKILRANGFAI